MKTLDRQSVKLMSEAFTKALQGIEKDYGVKVTYKGGRYSSSNVTFKFEAAIIGQNGNVMSAERTSYIALAEMHGMKASWLDQSFVWNCDTYKVIGLKPRSWKAPVLVESVRGKRYKMRPEMVINGFKGVK